MKLKTGLMGGLVLLLALGLSACEASPQQLATGHAYLAKARQRLAAIEKAESSFHSEDTRCGDHSRARVEEAIGKLVEARVYAREELARLKADDAHTEAQLKQRLEGKLKRAEQRLSDLQSLCQSS